ncbi:MAG TPA: sugar transferase [Chitinophagaceae bacterium]|nr:sugar transferase [Chitinophagaceae bacterium]
MSKNITLISPFTVPVETSNPSFSARSFVDSKKYYFLVKNIFDIAASLLFIIFILSWLTPIMALIIKIDSRGPVFFRQKRVGHAGKSFYCFKFRTMYTNDSCHTVQASCNDERITRVGKFLRKSNIDEFPQFINVLLGEMSIVGPRPHMHADCAKFSTLVQGYKFRNMVKPGITGLAQIKGFHGPAVTYDSIFHRFQYDAFYVRNASFWMDVRIIRRTAFERIAYLFK